MPSIYQLKSQFQNILRPIVDILAKFKISANQITILAMVISFITGILLYLFPNLPILLLAVPFVLLVRMALNAIDGMLAREHQMKTSLGAILNELGDVISDAVLYLPFGLISGVNTTFVVLFVLVATLTEMTGVIAIQIGAQRRYDGPFGKSDRAFIMSIIGVVLGFGISAEVWLDYTFVSMLLLSILTVINRARKALEEIA